ncbi:hypothetical protein A1O3_00325 [Capronia epimyces CBS 606.96]|uniref:Uncharacterized protein n=1 Tax=Capronia epimyces CBS 606.96 TaxID=1182542 RepID=W9YQ22_9EURO|nr:uncharacterized protein A1O3_00325 [Capronia epimyces CBS 606.96]EXJ91775.1 hypothetical protein A1O3_00325 [Capronia epimyces CBS 606.96]
MAMSQRQENMAAPPTTMKLVMNAVIGAVWLDAGLNANEGLRTVKNMLQIFGFFDWDFLDYVD